MGATSAYGAHMDNDSCSTELTRNAGSTADHIVNPGDLKPSASLLVLDASQRDISTQLTGTPDASS